MKKKINIFLVLLILPISLLSSETSNSFSKKINTIEIQLDSLSYQIDSIKMASSKFSSKIEIITEVSKLISDSVKKEHESALKSLETAKWVIIALSGIFSIMILGIGIITYVMWSSQTKLFQSEMKKIKNVSNKNISDFQRRISSEKEKEISKLTKELGKIKKSIYRLSDKANYNNAVTLISEDIGKEKLIDLPSSKTESSTNTYTEALEFLLKISKYFNPVQVNHYRALCYFKLDQIDFAREYLFKAKHKAIHMGKEIIAKSIETDLERLNAIKES